MAPRALLAEVCQAKRRATLALVYEQLPSSTADPLCLLPRRRVEATVRAEQRRVVDRSALCRGGVHPLGERRRRNEAALPGLSRRWQLLNDGAHKLALHLHLFLHCCRQLTAREKVQAKCASARALRTNLCGRQTLGLG